MKCLKTHLGIGVNMDNIISIEGTTPDLLPEDMKKTLDSDTKGVIVATDINNNEIILGEYSSDFHLINIIQDIMEWLSDPDSFDIYLVLEEDDEYPFAVDFPFYYGSYLSRRTEND